MMGPDCEISYETSNRCCSSTRRDQEFLVATYCPIKIGCSIEEIEISPDLERRRDLSQL